MKHILKYIELLIFFIFRSIFYPKLKNTNHSILLINTGQIGDLIVSSLLLENEEIYDEYEAVIFLIKEEYLGLFNRYKGKVKFIGYNYYQYKYNIVYKYQMIRKLNNYRFSQCINLTAARGILNEEITHLVSAEEKIALNSLWTFLGNKLGKYFDSYYDLIIGKNILNEYEKHTALIKYLTNDKTYPVKFNNGITFDENNTKTSRRAKLNKKVITIAPFSSQESKDWDIRKYKEIINILRNDYQIVLLGSKIQEEKLLNLTTNDPDVKIFAGTISLSNLPKIISESSLFIGVDTGLTHIALKIQVPLIAIIGGGEFGKFFPYRENFQTRYVYEKLDCYFCLWKCIYKEKSCLKNITVQQVLRECYELLNMR